MDYFNVNNSIDATLLASQFKCCDNYLIYFFKNDGRSTVVGCNLGLSEVHKQDLVSFIDDVVAQNLTT